MSELGNSLTDIGWLNQKLISSKSQQKCPDGAADSLAGESTGQPRSSAVDISQPERPASEHVKRMTIPQKPVLSYANLIVQAIHSKPCRMITLGEIYAWIANTYPYFRYTGNGWKNSIRHNLSLNKCFKKVDRPKDDKGKGCYWTIDRSFLDEDGCLKARTRTKSLNQGRSSPYGKSLSPGLVCMDGAPGFSQHHAFNSDNPNEWLSEVRDSTCWELNPSCALYSSVMNGQSVLTFRSDEGAEPPNETQFITDDQFLLHLSPNDLPVLSSNPSNENNSVDESHLRAFDTVDAFGRKPSFEDTGLSDSFKKLFKTAFENPDDAILSSECLRNYEGLKNSVKLASTTNWNEIDLSGFPDLAESIKSAECSNWSLDPDQVLDLAASLKNFYSLASLAKERPDDFSVINSDPNDDLLLLNDPLISKGNVVSIVKPQVCHLPKEQMAAPNFDAFLIDDGEIEDDFNWDSLLLPQ